MRYRSMLGPVAVMAGLYGLFAWMSGSPLDLTVESPSGHFYIVSLVSLLASGIAIAVGVAGAKLRNIKVQILSIAFLTLAAYFLIHGLSTPHFLLHDTKLSPVMSPLSIFLASVWLWLSSLPSDHPWVAFLSRRQDKLLPAWGGFIVASGTALMLRPELVSFIPLKAQPINWTVGSITIALQLIVMYSYYRSYLYSRFPLQISIVYSSGIMIVCQVIIIVGKSWHLSWWLYHVALLVSMLVMVAGLVRQYHTGDSLASSLKALFTSDPVERVTGSISPSIKALTVATERKDPYTAGHNLRVTLYALKIAEEMGLAPDELRAVAQGTIIHDVGKIDVPDAILNKPSRLSPEERYVIERHPLAGYEMCRVLGFMKEELDIIRWHHEKWNGTGYPDGLKGESIPLMARIVAVADVYDALTSSRAYRKAMTHAEAMAIIVDQRGEHFDPACVDAWIRVCDRHPSQIPIPADEQDEAAAAFLSPA